jgi:hypothetical protein
MDDIDRSIAASRQPLCEAGSCSNLYLIGETPYDRSENPDLVLGISAFDQKVRCMPQCSRARLGRSSRDGIFELMQESRRISRVW